MRRVEAGCRFGSKAQTLLGLSGRMRRGRTLPRHTFTVGEWRADESRGLRDIDVDILLWLNCPTH